MQLNYLNALAEPHRLEIVELLREQPCSVNQIAYELRLTQPQTSKHLKYLSEAGLVSMRPVAQKRIYSLNGEPFLQLSDWANSFERYWNNKLTSLDKHLSNLKKG